MASAFGLKPVKGLSGEETRCNYYRILSSTARIFKGDLVALDSSGNVARATAVNGPFLGVCLADTGTPASAQMIAVCDDPNQVYEIVATAVLSQTSLLLNYNYSVAAGTSATGQSASKLGSSSATIGAGLKALRLSRRVGNSFGAGQILEVQINNHAFRTGQISV
jgi:hypothetical protein